MGELIHPDYVSVSFKKLLQDNDMPVIRFHEPRHSCASLLLELDFNMKKIQEWLGHITYVTTADIYSHLDYRSKLEVSSKIGQLLGSTEEKTKIEDTQKITDEEIQEFLAWKRKQSGKDDPEMEMQLNKKGRP